MEDLSFGIQTGLFHSISFPPVVMWLVVSTLLVGIIISVWKRSSSARSPCSKTAFCNSTSAKKVPNDSCDTVELSGTSPAWRLKICEEEKNVECDCQCYTTDFQELVTCKDRPLEIVPLGLGFYKELLCTLIFMLLCEITSHFFVRENALVGMAVIKFVQFMTVVLGVLFAHLSLVPAEGLTRLELGLRVIIQNKLACLMSYMALKSIVLYGRIAELMFEVSEDTLSGVVVIYICIYASTMGVIEHMCLQQLFKFTIGTQIPIIVVLAYLIISGLLNTVFLIMACLWLMLSVTLFAVEIISAFRHIDDLYAPVQKEPLKGVTVEV